MTIKVINSLAQPVYLVDNAEGFALSSTQGNPGITSLAAGSATGAASGRQDNVPGRAYIWAYQFGGTSPSLKLQTLGPDGSTWMDIATVTASGQQQVVIGAGSSIRLQNSGGNPITNLYSTIS